eukprot:TRINITY_DN3465_c0_g1_i1.p1 TRINITY_DN3465_c0_g1~~TRINITY_DN3465_c0_g1_i1.p1  ORF type:complete len:242 (-),score=40.91 TRINITY_DN3465_c0_g1_i1:109-834(-)
MREEHQRRRRLPGQDIQIFCIFQSQLLKHLIWVVMSKKRGLSLEDKRQKLLEVFHENGDVFVLKDIEKLGAKKGVIPQSIKEVLQSLVDDNLVHQEKIGSSNYFWSFPGEASMQLQNDISFTERAIKELQEKENQLKNKISQAKTGKEQSKERQEGLKKLEGLQDLLKECQKEIDKYAQNDPELLASMKQAAESGKEAANRWLDNLETLLKWCRNQFSGMDAELKQFFIENGYDENMEYFE